MHFLIIFLLGILLSASLTGLAIFLFPKLNLLDFPERYHLHRSRLPYPGGLMLLIASFGIFFFDRKFWILAPALALLGIISFWDDRRPVSAKLRLLIHFVIAAGVFFAGVKIKFIGDPLHATNFELGKFTALSFLATTLWIVGVQNAMNWFDGLRGLAPAVSGIGFLCLGILGLIRPELFFDPAHTSLTMANLWLAGIALGGVWFFWKGKIILGDTGSQMFGFLLGVMSIFSGAKIATTLIVLAIPIIDAGAVALRRVWQGRSPFKGDLTHIHHHLAEKFGEKKSALILIALTLCLGGIAVGFSGFQKMIALVIVALGIFALSFWAARGVSQPLEKKSASSQKHEK